MVTNAILWPRLRAAWDPPSSRRPQPGPSSTQQLRAPCHPDRPATESSRSHIRLGAASQTRPSSAHLTTPQHLGGGHLVSRVAALHPRLGERQIPASPPEIGEGSAGRAHPTSGLRVVSDPPVFHVLETATLSRDDFRAKDL